MDRAVAETAFAAENIGDVGALPAGTQVARYIIESKLGEGGMGTVYAARDPQLGRRVALKIVSRAGAAPELRARAAREARMMARVTAPNIVIVFDAGEVGEHTYIAMELVDGETLDAWLARADRSVPAIVAAFRTAGEALVTAHDAGIVHRDFKPENVLVDRSGRVKVTDFGIATDMTAESGAADPNAPPLLPTVDVFSTRTGTVLGTPAYMSPEQLRGLKTTAASDQFSFAASLWEALYGQLPFIGMTFEEHRSAVLGNQLASLPKGVRKVPARTREVLEKALKPYPNSRFPDMSSFLVALDRSMNASSWRGVIYLALVAAVGVAAVLAVPRITAWRSANAAPGSIAVGSCASGGKPIIYFVFDNTPEIEARSAREPIITSIAATVRAVGPRAQFAVAAVQEPSRPNASCSIGGEVLAPMLGDAPGASGVKASQKITDVLLKLVPSSSPAAAMFARLEPTLVAMPDHPSIVFVTDGRSTCREGGDSCGAADCALNIESRNKCSPTSRSCCTTQTHASACNDDKGTAAAIAALREAGIGTYVVGIAAVTRYRTSLDAFASSGALRPGATHYYEAAPEDPATIDTAIRAAVGAALKECH